MYALLRRWVDFELWGFNLFSLFPLDIVSIPFTVLFRVSLFLAWRLARFECILFLTFPVLGRVIRNRKEMLNMGYKVLCVWCVCVFSRPVDCSWTST